jgi:hypothetical protein
MRPTSGDGGEFEVALILVALVFPCIAFAWDGLVRRQLLLHAFPFGGGSVTLKHIGSLLVALLAVAIGLVCVFFALGFCLVGSQLCHSSFACMVGLVEFPAWGWFGMWVVWFFYVWLRLGDPRKRVLVYGV